MSTLTGFTRPSDPINTVDIAAAISTAIGKTVNCVVTPTDVQVTGSTLVSGDTSAVQVAITAYFYAYLQYGAPISDNPTMSGTQHSRGVTEAVAYAGDLATYNLTRRKSYVSGVLKPDSFIYASKAVTAGGSGLVTFWITDDGTSGGNAVFTNVYADSMSVGGYGASGQYQASGLTVAGDRKSITATISQITTVLVLTFNASAANGIECRLYVMGD